MRSSEGERVRLLLLNAREGISIYVHIPFCARKCPYCSFFSVVPRSGEIEEYCALLRSEIRNYAEMLTGGGLSVQTLYFGGGTPSMLPPPEWERLLVCLRESFHFAPGMEISVEANPDSLTKEHAAVWKSHGVTRTSIGAQSFSDEELRRLGRLHNAEEARRAVRLCVRSGFSVNADFMFGLKEQTLRSFVASVKEAIQLGVEHLSLYQLVTDEECRWHDDPDEQASDGYPFYRWCQWYLPKKGFAQYEISNFARPGKECHHNEAYWTNGPVLALGAGAWGYAKGVRCHNELSLAGYAAAIEKSGYATAWTESPGVLQRAREEAVLLLRTSRGIEIDAFSSRHGANSISEIVRTLAKGAPHDCFIQDSSRFALSPKGMRIANSLWSLIL